MPLLCEFALKTLPLLRQRYVDKGLVKFVSHDLPLGFHAYAMPAAVAARCAGEQGAYWPYRESAVSAAGPAACRALRATRA